MTRWLDPQTIDIPPSLRDAVGGHPLVVETLVRRGIRTPEAARAFLDPTAYTPAMPDVLPDLDLAVDRLRQAIAHRERVAVWGDFDADGQTATALLLETLRALAADVVFRVPTRQEGHGLHQSGLQDLVGKGVRLILTCDTGVTAHAAIAHAGHLGAEVIVTDHHVPGERLPPALATINPHRLPAGHPLFTLTGVGVAYQLASALDPVVADQALDLVALGTVADVGTLTGDNRYLVQRGLDVLRCTSRTGLQAVYQAADLRPEGLTEEHVGFVLGPRLNALGRLADASHGVELLTTSEPTRARILATEVEGLNARRQWLTKQVTDAALAQIQRNPSLLSDYHALVLSHPTWPGGIIGIVAGRLADRFGKPAVLISAPADDLARGSGRSIPGVDLIAALTDCASPGPGAPLLQSFGGHAGAAGFSIHPDRIPELRDALSRAVASRAQAVPQPLLSIDAYVELSDLTLDLVADVSRLAPFGPGNPPLSLAVRDLRILSEATIGRTGEHRRLTVQDPQDRTGTVFWWHGADWPLPRGRFDLALTVRTSDYRGTAEVQLEWLDARELEPPAVEVEPVPPIQATDYRTVGNPEAVLEGLLAEGEVQIWAEGDGPPGLKTYTRRQLVPGPRLAVWSLPPGPHELQAALASVQAMEIILFAHDPGLDELEPFLHRLAGLVRFALRARAGEIDLEAAAARLAHRTATLLAGLELMAAQGTIAVTDRGKDCWRLVRGTQQPDPQAADAAHARLEAMLAETAAYRQYVRSSPASSLVHLSVMARNESAPSWEQETTSPPG
jgi:single-stranded-DNA-specific exonuclease